jgi:hypothetical protein
MRAQDFYLFSHQPQAKPGTRPKLEDPEELEEPWEAQHLTHDRLKLPEWAYGIGAQPTAHSLLYPWNSHEQRTPFCCCRDSGGIV